MTATTPSRATKPFSPWLILLPFIALTAVLGWQARLFEVDASADTLLTRDNPLYIRSQIVNQDFAPQEFLLIAYAPQSHPVLSDKTFADLRALTTDIKRLERVESVRSLLNVPFPSLLADGFGAGADLASATIEKQHFTPTQLREALAGHPLYEDLLVNRDATATALQVLFKPDPDTDALERRILAIKVRSLERALSAADAAQLKQLEGQKAPLLKRLDATRITEIERLRDIVQKYEDDAAIYLGGAHVLAYQLITIIENDLVVFGLAIAALISVLLLMLFRKPRWVLITLSCCAVSVLVTMGILGTLGLKATVISANFIALQLILTLAIVVHLIVQYREFATTLPDASQRELIAATLREKIAPCLFAGLSTSVGFASLLASGIQPVMSFGWMMITAMAVSIAVSLLLFPALLALLPRETAQPDSAPAQQLLAGLARVALGSRALMAVACFALIGICVTGAMRLTVENSFINYFRASTDVHRELSFIDREMGGSTPLDVVLTMSATADNERDLVLSAAQAQRIQAVHTALQRRDGIGKVLSVDSFAALAKRLNNNRPVTEYELSAVYYAMDKATRDDLIGSYYLPDSRQARIGLRVADATPNLNRQQLITDIRSDMARIGLREEDYTLSGLFVLYQDMLQRLFRSQVLTLGIVFAVLTLAFCLIFRSLKVGLIAIAPNILATALIFGIMGWLSIPLDLMTITIASIAMGIGVDDTIHYIHRYLEELRSKDPEAAVLATHSSVGSALLYTTLIIALGFGLLCFSDFVPGILFGLLTGIAMLLALLTDLTLLPMLLRRFVTAV